MAEMPAAGDTPAPAAADEHLYHGAPFDLARIRKPVFAALMQARRRYGGNKVAVIDADGRELTYNDLTKAAFALGHALKAGTQSGEAVAILLPTGAGAIISFYAISAYGRIPAMLNFTAGPKALKAACQACNATRIVTARRFIELGELQALEAELAKDHELIYLEDVRENLSSADKLAAAAGLIAPWSVRAHPDPDDAAVYLFTSGTEGDPKGVVLSHANLLANVEQVRDHVPIFPTDKVFNPLPTFHCFGLTGGVLVPIGLGIPAVCHPTPLQAKTIVKRIAETKATVLFATDTFMNQYARAADPADLSSLRMAVCGAERVKDETRSTLRKRFNVEIVEGYGLTEAAPVLAVNQPENNRPGSVGQLLGGCTAKLVPVEGITDAGQLWIKGPNVMRGYIRPSAPLVIEAPKDGWHDTGDIVSIDEDGFISIRGRVKRFAKLGGEMVSLTVVENCATSVWPDHMHAAAALPDARKGEQVVLLTDNPKADRADLVAFYRSHGVSELAIPRKILHVASIPVLGTGKTDYGSVQKMAEKAMVSQVEPAE